MRKEDFYVEQYDGDAQVYIADAPLWEGQPLPMSRRNKSVKDRHLLPGARILLRDYFDTRRMPPEDVIAAVRHLAWEDLEESGGSLDALGDRFYVLYFLSMVPELSYIKVGRAANKLDDKGKNTRQVTKRISAHEGEATIAQAILLHAWISHPCATAKAWEDGVKKHLSALGMVMDVGDRVKAEYFRGIDFPQAVRAARMHQ